MWPRSSKGSLPVCVCIVNMVSNCTLYSYAQFYKASLWLIICIFFLSFLICYVCKPHLHCTLLCMGSSSSGCVFFVTPFSWWTVLVVFWVTAYSCKMEVVLCSCLWSFCAIRPKHVVSNKGIRRKNSKQCCTQTAQKLQSQIYTMQLDAEI
jgi:hypothetical protein